MITRSRMAVVLLGLTFFFSLILGPLSYAGTIVEDEDRFVAAAGTVIEHPEIRRAVADEVTQLTFASIEADETVAELLPESARTFVVPITQFAAAQVTQVAFVLLDTELAVEARDASLRELHRQVVADDDELVIDLRAMLVRTTRELAGSSVAAGVAQVVSGQDTGRFVVAEAGSEEAQILDLVRALPAIGSWAALGWLLTLGGGIAVARDRQQALLIGGLLVVAGTVVGLVIVVVLLYAVLGGLGSSSLGPAVADAIATDFVAQQRGTIVVGLVLAGAGLLLGESPAAVALRRLPRALWQRDRRAISDAIGHALGDNPAVASIVVWVTAGVTLGSWSNPTIRVTATVIVITVIARITLWLHRSGTPRADDWRQRLGIVIPSLDPDAGERGEWGPAIRARRAIEQDPRSTRLRFWRLNVAIAFGIAFLFWPRWGVSLVVGFFVVLAFVQAGLEVPEAWRVAVAERQITGVPATSAPAEPPRSRWAGAALAGGLVVAALVAVTIQGGDRAEAATGCNGHAELCDRRVDDVVFAGSHNSMSSTELGWDLAMQTGDIIAQLDHGVRALLIDTHYWSADGRLDGGPDAAADAVIEASLSTDVPQPGTWLCHGFCALGATNLEAALADITFWLAANPRGSLISGKNRLNGQFQLPFIQKQP
ncbi:MAG: hypothetical protein AAF531_19125 [Actinomycetota bacterium]